METKEQEQGHEQGQGQELEQKPELEQNLYHDQNKSDKQDLDIILRQLEQIADLRSKSAITYLTMAHSVARYTSITIIILGTIGCLGALYVSLFAPNPSEYNKTLVYSFISFMVIREGLNYYKNRVISNYIRLANR